MLEPIDRLMIEDILRVTAARLAAPAGAALRGAGKTSPAQLNFESYKKWGGRYPARQMYPRGGFKWLRAAAALAAAGVDLAHDHQHPEWARLRAGRFGAGRALEGVIPSRAAIVEDILRVTAAAGLAPPVRPSFKEYKLLGGRHAYHHVQARGGWPALCVEAGFAPHRVPKDDIEGLRRLVIADIARVAATAAAADSAAATSNGLSRSEYIAAGGRFPVGTLQTVAGADGWAALCEAAGVKAAPPRRSRRRWRKTASFYSAGQAAPAGGMSPKQVDAAVDRAAAAMVPPKPMARLMGNVRYWKQRRAATRGLAVHDRDEVIADIRQVARMAGVYVLLLRWETYRSCGGRYSLDQVREFGGFRALCRAAAASRAA